MAVNAGADTLAALVSLGFWDPDDIIEVDPTTDIGYGYAYGGSRVAGETIVAILTVGASRASDAGKLSTGFSKGILAFDAAQNVTSGGRAIVDIKKEGLNLSNGAQLSLAALGGVQLRELTSSNPKLYWHGSREAVEDAKLNGLFAHGVGNDSGRRFWATSRNKRGRITDWLIGGNTNVDSIIPWRTSTKEAFEAVYELTPEEASKFKRAFGPGYSFNIYQWYKGGIGQFYYNPNGIAPGQRITELKRGGAITIIVVSGTYVGDKLINE